MGDITFTQVRVHNEFEFFSVSNMDVKKKLESLFQSNRISYYEKWENDTFLKRLFHPEKQNLCTFCINTQQREKALELLDEHPELKNSIQFVNKRMEKNFFY